LVFAILDWFDADGMELMLRQCYQPVNHKKVGLVLAGNVPLVGFHDVLMGLLSGHQLFVKPSGKDRVLLEAWLHQLPADIARQVALVERLEEIELDFLVATGSNTTAVQLRDQYQGIPQLIRKNRFSIAVLDGQASENELDALAKDCLLYHGMGCRSVSNVLVPESWESATFLAALDRFPSELLAQGWFDNLRYQAAAFAVSNVHFQKSRNLILLEAKALASPLFGCLNIVRYKDMAHLHSLKAGLEEQLQCSLGLDGLPLGSAQCPALDQFADGVDLLALLREL
jgi:hypothetical protein